MLVLLLVNGHSKSFAHIVDYRVNNLGQLLAVNSTPIAPYRQSLPLQVLTGNGGWKCKNRHNKPHCRISCGSANIGKVAAYIPKTVVTHRDCYYSFVLIPFSTDFGSLSLHTIWSDHSHDTAFWPSEFPPFHVDKWRCRKCGSGLYSSSSQKQRLNNNC